MLFCKSTIFIENNGYTRVIIWKLCTCRK